jgi:undecaprenyl diphosphate synthase
MTLCLALDYGGTWDILQVAENVRRMIEEGRCPPGPFTQEAMTELLGSGSVPPSDLLIRTGGDSRTSNFLPWQLNYAELMFVSKLWPDFCEADLLECFREFSRRRRRFGTIPDESAPVRPVAPSLAGASADPGREGRS